MKTLAMWLATAATLTLGAAACARAEAPTDGTSSQSALGVADDASDDGAPRGDRERGGDGPKPPCDGTRPPPPPSSPPPPPPDAPKCGACTTGTVCCATPEPCAGTCVPDCRPAPDRCPSGSTCDGDGVCKRADGQPPGPPPPPPPPPPAK